MTLKPRKVLLIILIIVSYLPILIFQDYTSVSNDLFEFGFWGRFLGLIGVVTLMWQYILGVRAVASRFVPDLFWINEVHKFLGSYVITLFLLHPPLISAFYIMNGMDSFSNLSLATEFDRLKFVGMVAYVILFITWLLSAVIRDRLSFRTWKRIHLLNFLVLPLALVHSMGIGSDFIRYGFLSSYWNFIALLYIVLLLYRLVGQIGIFKYHFHLQDKVKVAENTFELTFRATGKMLQAPAGQFIYIKLKSELLGEWHPFTIVRIDPDNSLLTITPKEAGPFTRKLNQLEPGAEVFIDGPYGIFTLSVPNHNQELILVAGGIGITPFLWMIEKAKAGWDRKITLFYGNKDEHAIAYQELIENAAAANSNFKVIHVLSDQPDFSGEKGFITTELIKKHVKDIDHARVYMSGPPVMIKNIFKAAQKELPHTTIEYELFEL